MRLPIRSSSLAGAAVKGGTKQTDKQLFVALLSCSGFAKLRRPVRAVAIVAVSHDEATGKAIAQARRTWRGDRYSDHNAIVTQVSQELIDQVR